ncbi:MAG: cell wall hydrolase [Anaerovorax sp.]
MPYDARELLARLIQCEAGGEGDDGMRAVATVILNRVNAQNGEFSRISRGGNVRNIIFQPGQFVCATTTVKGQKNEQNIYNMTPTAVHYNIADWALSGNRLNGIDHSLFFFNPFSDSCPKNFPPGGIGVIHNRIGDHCFYIPTIKYATT